MNGATLTIDGRPTAYDSVKVLVDEERRVKVLAAVGDERFIVLAFDPTYKGLRTDVDWQNVMTGAQEAAIRAVQRQQ